MGRYHRRAHLHHQRVKRNPQETLTQIHYVTLKPTFSGPVARYSTVKPDEEEEPITVKTTTPPPSRPQTTTKAPQTTNLPQTTKKEELKEEEEEEPTPTEVPSPTEKPTEKPESSSRDVTSSPRPTKSASIEEEEEEEETETVEVKTATNTKIKTTSSLTETVSSSLATNTINSAFETTSPTPTSIAAKDDSGSNGASIGGIIGGSFAAVFVLLIVAAFFYRKRKQRTMNEAYGKTEDEKAIAGAVMGGASPPNEKAPRVSLRPVTQFNPALNPPAASPIVKTGPSAGIGGAGGAGAHGIPRKPIPAPLALSKPPQSDMQPATGDSVSAPPAPVMPAAQPSPTLSAFSDGFVPGTPVQGPVDASILVAAGKPAPVYRVQMDYIPSQPDELEIRVGSLVRMLHEYDDGWALCVRMDRSQQGVCPRTCLSPRPVKPRPHPAPGSPANQQRRGPPPPANGRPPHHGSPQGPPQGPFQANPQSRPQSPAGSQRYVPYPGSRPGTPSQQQRPQTPRSPQQTQTLPQITVTPTEPDFPQKRLEVQVTSTPEAPGNADPPVFHAM